MKKWHWWTLTAITVVSFIIEKFFMHHDPKHHFWWNDIPGFFIIFGFVGCVAIIVVSKYIGKKLLQKDEDYYDDL